MFYIHGLQAKEQIDSMTEPLLGYSLFERISWSRGGGFDLIRSGEPHLILSLCHFIQSWQTADSVFSATVIPAHCS